MPNDRTVTPANPDTDRDSPQERAERLVASRRWTRSDLDLLRALAATDAIGRDALLGGDPTRARSLQSLLKLNLATEADGTVRMDSEAKAVAAAVLAWHAGKQVKATIGPAAEGRKRGEDLKRSIADGVKAVFPRVPAEVAMAVAVRLSPAAVKMGRLPAAQAMIEALVEIRLDRWRQAVTAEPEVAARLLAMQARGDANRACKRYRDQRAVERVEAEILEWRGALGPVTSRRLG